MAAYYNEHDPKAAAWLRELIATGLLAPGDVDERSILDVRPHELTNYTQQHFFAGIGGWSYALRLAGWPDARPVRTGSCPCQPFSAAGKQLAEKDERHLWPAFRDLITFGEPTITFGEQVASALGRDWLSGVRADLEGLGYEVGAADLCASSAGEEGEGWVLRGDRIDTERIVIGAPHIRQRLYWMAHSAGARCDGAERGAEGEAWNKARLRVPGENGAACGLVLADCTGRQSGWSSAEAAGHGRSAESTSRWSNFDALPYRDGKARRVESGTFPLANGIPDRVGLLRGYGNAIVPQLAAEFIQAACEALAI